MAIVDVINKITGGSGSNIEEALTHLKQGGGEGGGSGGGGGASSLSDLTDLQVTSLSNGDVLKYDSTSQKWKNDSPTWAELIETTSPNVFDMNDVINNKVFYPWDGSKGDVNGAFCSYIPCEVGTYTFLAPYDVFSGNTGKIPLFDIDKEFVKQITGNVSEYDENHRLVTITISSSDVSSGVFFFGFSEKQNLINTLMVVKGSTYPSTYIESGTMRTIDGLQITQSQIVDLDTENNPLRGKIASFNGDSICAGAGFSGGYAAIIGSENGMIIDNVSVSGATIAPGTNVAHIISTSISDMRSDADYVILEGGVNDADLSVTLGTITGSYTSTLDTTTFAGAFEDMLKSAISRYPGKKIGYILVHKCSSSFDSRSTNSYYSVAIEACKKWGIPYLDLNSELPPIGHIDALKNAFTSNGDGYHPNESGYRAYYVPRIVAWMKTL